MKPLKDSPVDLRRKEMPTGDCNWLGYDACYNRLKSAATYLSKNMYTRLCQDHIDIMASMGSGHEETMKYYMGLAITYNWI